jgi:hypothetical protein
MKMAMCTCKSNHFPCQKEESSPLGECMRMQCVKQRTLNRTRIRRRKRFRNSSKLLPLAVLHENICNCSDGILSASCYDIPLHISPCHFAVETKGLRLDVSQALCTFVAIFCRVFCAI